MLSAVTDINKEEAATMNAPTNNVREKRHRRRRFRLLLLEMCERKLDGS